MARTVADFEFQTHKQARVKSVFSEVGISPTKLGEMSRGTPPWEPSVVTRRAVLGGAAAMLASPLFGRPLWPSTPRLGVRVDISRGARARVHTISFDEPAARDSLHVIELLDRLVVVSVSEQAIVQRDLDRWCRAFAKPITRRYSTSPSGDHLDGERSNFGGAPTADRAQAGIEIISGEPIEIRRVARAGGERLMVGLPRDRILITGKIVVNGSPDRRYRGQTIEERAALTLCQNLPYTRILPSRGRPGGRELYESMLRCLVA
jgi:hypothetical protein